MALTAGFSEMAARALDLRLKWIWSAYSAISWQSVKFLATMWSLMSMGRRIRKRAMKQVPGVSPSGMSVVKSSSAPSVFCL